MSIEQRLGKLEKRMQATGKGVTIIIRALVAADEGKPRNPPLEVIGAGMTGSDWHLSRNPGESEEDFTERVIASVPRKEGGLIPLVSLKYAD